MAREYHGECSSCRSAGMFSEIIRSRLDSGLWLSMVEMSEVIGHKIACCVRGITKCLYVAIRTTYS